MIGIIDYGMGNLRSVQKAIERMQATAVICDSPTKLDGCEKLILPGVGAFRSLTSPRLDRLPITPSGDTPAAPSGLLLLLVALALGCDSKPTAEEPASLDLGFRPNILWLVAEDLSPIIPPFGDSTVTTPTLSRLAAEGVRYTHVFSPSGVCAPSRAAIATGMYQNHIGAMHMRTGGDPRWHSAGSDRYSPGRPRCDT